MAALTPVEKAQAALTAYETSLNAEDTYLKANCNRLNPKEIDKTVAATFTKFIASHEKALKECKSLIAKLPRDADETEEQIQRLNALKAKSIDILGLRQTKLKIYNNHRNFDITLLTTSLPPEKPKPLRETVKAIPGNLLRSAASYTRLDRIPGALKSAKKALIPVTIGGSTLASFAGDITSSTNPLTSATRIVHSLTTGLFKFGSSVLEHSSDYIPKGIEKGLSDYVAPAFEKCSGIPERAGSAVSSFFQALGGGEPNFVSRFTAFLGNGGADLMNGAGRVVTENAVGTGQTVKNIMDFSSGSLKVLATSYSAQGAVAGALVVNPIARQLGVKNRAAVHTLGAFVGAGMGKLADRAVNAPILAAKAAEEALKAATEKAAKTAAEQGYLSKAGGYFTSFFTTPEAPLPPPVPPTFTEEITANLSAFASQAGTAIQNNPEIVALVATAVVVGAIAYKTGHLGKVAGAAGNAALAVTNRPKSVLAPALVTAIAIGATAPVAASAIGLSAIAGIGFNLVRWMAQ